MSRLKWLWFPLLGLILLAPSLASAQAISGIVTDTTGAVMPGVTVEASSPALIERTRTVTTDGAGRYSIVNLTTGVYTVTFTLDGFNTVKRDNVTLTNGFTAPINVQLAVGSRQEVITVTAASPLVDVTSIAKTSTVTTEMLDALPLGNRTIHDVILTVPGTSVGFFGNDQYRGSSDTLTTVDGNRVSWLNGPQGGSTQALSPAAYQEYTVTTGLDNLDIPSAGMNINVVPKDGGNELKGSAFILYSGEGWSGDNVTAALKKLTPPITLPADEVLNLDINPTFGGPILRDKLWYQNSFHFNRGDNHSLGLFPDANPDPFIYTAGTTPFVQKSTQIGGGTRITWQATQRDKVVGSYDDQHWSAPVFFSNGQGTSPESANNLQNPHSRNIALKWSRTHTSKLLFEGGYSNFYLEQSNELRDPMMAWSATKGSANPGYPTPPIPAVKDMEIIEGTFFGRGIGSQPAGGFTGNGGNYSPSKSWTANAAMTYITGSHNFKVGMNLLRGETVAAARDIADVVLYLSNGVPAQIDATRPRVTTNNIDGDWGFYAQDTYVLKQLTLKGGVRFDWLKTSYPDQVMAKTIWNPASTDQNCGNNPVFCGKEVLNWKDLSPRIGATYDLFGNGKTAVKAGFARYVGMETTALTNSVNPVSSIVRSSTEAWRDDNHNGTIYKADGTIDFAELNVTSTTGTAGRISNQNFGFPTSTTSYDPDVLRGYGKRPYTWEYTLGVDHQVFSRLAAGLTYYHRADGNQRATDNLNLTLADFDAYCLVAPTDARLGSVSGSEVCGLYDVKQASQFKGNLPGSNYVQLVKGNLGDKSGWTDINQGFDISLTSRLPKGAFVAGGVDIRKTLTDHCSFINETGGFTPSLNARFCRNETAFRPGYRLNGSYVLPYGVQVSGVYQASRGPQYAATWVANRDDIYNPAIPVADRLGRDFTGNATTTKNITLIEPNTQFLPYIHNFDMRFSKIFNINRYRFTAGVDLYNAFNSSAVTAINTTFGGTADSARNVLWLNPTSIPNPRQIRINGTFDF